MDLFGLFLSPMQSLYTQVRIWWLFMSCHPSPGHDYCSALFGDTEASSGENFSHVRWNKKWFVTCKWNFFDPRTASETPHISLTAIDDERITKLDRYHVSCVVAQTFHFISRDIILLLFVMFRPRRTLAAPWCARVKGMRLIWEEKQFSNGWKWHDAIHPKDYHERATTNKGKKKLFPHSQLRMKFIIMSSSSCLSFHFTPSNDPIKFMLLSFLYHIQKAFSASSSNYNVSTTYYTHPPPLAASAALSIENQQVFHLAIVVSRCQRVASHPRLHDV